MVIVAMALVVPFIGNKIVQGEIEKNLEMLSSYGIKIQERTEDNTYFKTNNHIKLFVEDGDTFILWINQFAANQLPLDTAEFFEGAVVGVDLEYWNFPISDSLAITFYPIEIPALEEVLLETNEVMTTFVQSFLKKKGLVYHLNLNTARGGFDGSLKDIKETLTYFEDDLEIMFAIEGVVYKGEGPLVAPTKLNSKLDLFRFEVKKEDEKVVILEIKNITTDAAYESDVRYLSSLHAKTFHFKLYDNYENLLVNGNDLSVSVNAQVDGAKASGAIQTSLQELEIQIRDEAFKMKQFNHALHISEVNKESYEKLKNLIQQAQNNASQIDGNDFEESLIELMSKGIVLELKDFSIMSITVNNQDLKNIGLQAKITLDPIVQPLHSFNDAMNAVRDNGTLEATFTVSKEMFDFIGSQVPFASLATVYAKESGNNYVFEVKYGNDDLLINGKSL